MNYRLFFSLILLTFFLGCSQNKPSSKTKELRKNSNHERNELEEIKNGKTLIRGYPNSTDFVQIREDYQEFKNIFQLNVLQYFSLEDKYETPLQKKSFYNSVEYKDKSDSLKNLRSKLFRKTFYLNFKPENPYQKVFIYDLKSQTFNFNVSHVEDKFSRDLNYLVLDYFIFELPKGIIKNSKYYKDGPIGYTTKEIKENKHGLVVDMINQEISMKVKDESIALKIENNRDNVGILITFKFKSYDDNYFFTKLNTFSLYDDSLNRVYKTYKPKKP